MQPYVRDKHITIRMHVTSIPMLSGALGLQNTAVVEATGTLLCTTVCIDLVLCREFGACLISISPGATALLNMVCTTSFLCSSSKSTSKPEIAGYSSLLHRCSICSDCTKRHTSKQETVLHSSPDAFLCICALVYLLQLKRLIKGKCSYLSTDLRFF